MLTPLGMLNNHLAEKARKQALAGSQVKVVGIDVMATKKLSTTMMLYPVICLSFTLFFFVFVVGHLYISVLTYRNFVPRVVSTSIFFILFPIYSYICILARDNLVSYYKLF